MPGLWDALPAVPAPRAQPQALQAGLKAFVRDMLRDGGDELLGREDLEVALPEFNTLLTSSRKSLICSAWICGLAHLLQFPGANARVS